MLFSEPKIPQFTPPPGGDDVSWGFSALQRAENSSIWNIRTILNFIVKFQCSSASRKFLNDDCRTYSIPHTRRFSALQRAENSSIIATPFQIVSQRQSFSALQRAENSSMHPGNDADWIVEVFQCSSASRKFLNLSVWVAISPARDRFSALQRAENSSICPAIPPDRYWYYAFQCSSASRKFLNDR